MQNQQPKSFCHSGKRDLESLGMPVARFIYTTIHKFGGRGSPS